MIISLYSLICQLHSYVNRNFSGNFAELKHKYFFPKSEIFDNIINRTHVFESFLNETSLQGALLEREKEGGNFVSELIKILESKIPRKVWELWFSTLKFDSVDHEAKKIKLIVGNLFIKEWLEKKYGKVIQKSVEQTFGKDYTYSIDFETVNSDFKADKTIESPEPIVKKRPLILSNLNDEYTFENFVYGDENEFAYRVAFEVAKQPGIYNPLFLTGDVGLGKTHLMQAIGHHIINSMPEVRVLYTTSEAFANELIKAFKENSSTLFREKYRKKVDVLLIDDIQFLIGKNGIQTELFHTMNELLDQHKQIIICSDRPLSELKEFQDRLLSRFQMGLFVKINPPRLQTRKLIVKNFSKRYGLKIREDVLDYIAQNIQGSVRRLKGAVMKLLAQQKFAGNPVNLSEAAQLLKELVDSPAGPKVDFKTSLLKLLADNFEVSIDELLSSSRKNEVSFVRMIGMYIAVEYFGYTPQEVGSWFNRGRTTVIHGIKKLKSLKIDDRIINKMVFIRNQLSAKTGDSVI